MTTIQEALAQATEQLAKVGLPTPRLDAQVLLAHVFDVDRVALLTYPERSLTNEQAEQFRQLVERRARHEPVAYLTGHKEFYGLDFLVDSRVLIPRPETEMLVEAALRAIRARLDAGQTPLVADIGAGSGAIPVALAVTEPRLPYLYAVDISRDALEVARLNCQRHHVADRVRLLHGDLLAPLPEPVDIVIANLPYVGTEEATLLSSDVIAYEPHLALFSGPHGLDLLNRFFTEVQQSSKLQAHAVLLLEIGYDQREPLTAIIQTLWPQALLTVEKDYAGWDRLLTVSF
jgi:release factor glutamine methyltransferase